MQLAAFSVRFSISPIVSPIRKPCRGPFSAVSAAGIARKGAFCSSFDTLRPGYVASSQIAQNRAKNCAPKIRAAPCANPEQLSYPLPYIVQVGRTNLSISPFAPPNVSQRHFKSTRSCIFSRANRGYPYPNPSCPFRSSMIKTSFILFFLRETLL